jgi:hypothetical protein
MKNLKKRLAAVALMSALLVSAFPIAASAAPIDCKNNVVKVGGGQWECQNKNGNETGGGTCSPKGNNNKC